MKLYDIPKGSKLNLIDDKGEPFTAIFEHLDGMYSYCSVDGIGVVHLAGGTPLRKVGDAYEIVKDE